MRTVDKFYVPFTVEQLTSGQKDEKKTKPGVNRKVAVDGQRFDGRRTYGYFHTKDQNTAIAHMTRPTQTGSSSRRRRNASCPASESRKKTTL